MKWYIKVIKQYLDFNGRARRKEYWMFNLFHYIFLFVAIMIDSATSNTEGVGVFYLVYLLGTLLPSIAVTVRRLHDIGKSGSYFFLGLIPIIGSIWLLVYLVTEGNSGENAYGPDPKGDLNYDLIDEIGS